MILNEIGKMADLEWIKTIDIWPDMNLELGVFVVKPDHFHAIIIINENEFNKYNSSLSLQIKPSDKPQN